MSRFAVHTLDTAPEASRPLLDKLRGEVGFIPNLAATMAESPALLESFLSVRAVNGRGSSLSPAEREIVSVAVAAEFSCAYCVAAHSTFGIRLGAPADVIDDARSGRLPADAHAAALIRFTRRLIQSRWRATEEDVEQFLSAGFERRQIFDIFATIAQVLLASQASLLAEPPLDAAFQPQAWSSAAS